jgi:nucleoside 2-deoxyribosyltransferase
MSRIYRVYLAGPINGTSDSEANAWRSEVKKHFSCVDPMDRDYRSVEDQNVAAIVDGDKDDIESCDVVLANCWKPSPGTSMEIIFAWFSEIPVVTVVPEGPVSPWIRYHSTAVVRDLADAIREVERALLLGDAHA